MRLTQQPTKTKRNIKTNLSSIRNINHNKLQTTMKLSKQILISISIFIAQACIFLSNFADVTHHVLADGIKDNRTITRKNNSTSSYVVLNHGNNDGTYVNDINITKDKDNSTLQDATILDSIQELKEPIIENGLLVLNHGKLKGYDILL